MLDKVAYPTVGRIVHYHDPDHVEPFAAIVTVAKEDRSTIPVLTVFLHDGVRVVQDTRHKDELVRDLVGWAYWDWMDYQKGQAAKTEALQAQLEQSMKAAVSAANRPLPKDVPEIDERYKNEASTPSREDGKR